ncbi:zinc ribbon-containing protein [Clostridium beijerinckii]|nr:zinc ribbon-containing protein [Clostridium beijerinckii]UYZ36779.1 zinc ribbon-containing protein [Clostridium beijerinckii]
MPKTGEKPGIGTYRCTKCGELVHLDQNSDTLPPCPKCHATDYTRA